MSLFAEWDRALKWFFENDAALSLDQVLSRGFAFRASSWSPDMIASFLKWGVWQGVVRLRSLEGTTAWVLDHHGVTFVPRGRTSLDARLPQATAPLPFPSLRSREAKRRARDIAEERARLQLAALWCLEWLPPEMPVPPLLQGPDYLPANCIGDFGADLAGYIDGLPTWRIAEVASVTFDLRVGVPPLSERGNASDLDDLNM